jgi:hypothetical protein
VLLQVRAPGDDCGHVLSDLFQQGVALGGRAAVGQTGEIVVQAGGGIVARPTGMTRPALRAYPCRSEQSWKSIDFQSFSEKVAATGIGS